MKVQLLKDITEGEGEGATLKVAKRKNKNWTPPKVVDGELVECGESEYRFIPYIAGTIMEASETTANKWIERGLALPVLETGDGE